MAISVVDRTPATTDSSTVEIWEFEADADAAGAAASDSPSAVKYISSKVVLIGDSGVGKTGLAWCLANGDFQEQRSTHGQQVWIIDQMRGTRDDGAECEVILWDLAGQPDYRIIHALDLEEADAALLVFDGTHDSDPLDGVEYWLQQLTSRAGRLADDRPPPAIILVSGRADRGTARVSADDLAAVCSDPYIEHYVVTSAATGEGIPDLVDRLRTALRWHEKSAIVTTESFKQLRTFILGVKEDPFQALVLSMDDLREAMDTAGFQATASDDEILAAIGHLAKHGHVTQLSTTAGEFRLLLRPELLNNLAASLVLEARRNPRGLGALEEDALARGEYDLPELAGLSLSDREVLLDTAVARFLDRTVCFRQTDPLNARVYLVFPELINLKRPLRDTALRVDDGPTYTASGAVTNLYASLVVLMGYAATFARTDQWTDGAQYEFGDGLVCGFRSAVDNNVLQFRLYYGIDVPQRTKHLFEGLFESFLTRKDVVARRIDVVNCVNGHRLNTGAVREQVALGSRSAFCTTCGVAVSLDGVDVDLAQDAPTPLPQEHAEATRRSRLEQVLYRFSAYVAQEELSSLEVFISYAWGEADTERWVESELASDLAKAGIDVVLDRWENARIGAHIPRFVERVDSANFVLVVGTPAYRRKYENKLQMGGFVAAAEGDLIGGEAEKESVLPLLLAGTRSASFPRLLQARIYADFRGRAQYGAKLLELLFTLHGISPRDQLAIELRRLLEQ